MEINQTKEIMLKVVFHERRTFSHTVTKNRFGILTIFDCEPCSCGLRNSFVIFSCYRGGHFCLTRPISHTKCQFHKGVEQGTVVLRTKETSAVYRSKMAFFKRAWQKVTVMSRPWALGFKSEMIRPLKWGTLCSRIPSGSKNTSRQSWKNKK